MQISDRKYKGMMRMIDVALPRFGNDGPAATGQPVQSAAPRRTSFTKSRVAKEDEEFLLDRDSDKDHKEQDVAGAKDEFFDTEDFAEGVSCFRSLRS